MVYNAGVTGIDMRVLRVRLGLTQAGLGAALGISVSQVGQYERGYTRGDRRPVTIPRVVELACEALEARHARGEPIS
jgi:transcriptional regulator with XRE-family HTH domain